MQHRHYPRIRTPLALLLTLLMASFVSTVASAKVYRPAGCKQFKKAKRFAACMKCVQRPRPHAFTKKARKVGTCTLVAKPIVGAGIKTVAGCRGKIVKPALKSACTKCVRRPKPHRYVKHARKGMRCKPIAKIVKIVKVVKVKKVVKVVKVVKVKPAPRKPGIKTVAGCRGKIVKPGLKSACTKCVRRKRPHRFVKRGRKGQRCKLL